MDDGASKVVKLVALPIVVGEIKAALREDY
jgi:hypothetical protein